MAGRMGSETVTVKNLEVIEITNDGMLLIKGLVPGSVNSIVVIKKMGTNKKFVPLYKEAVVEPGEALGSSQQLEESSDASTPVSDDSGHGQASPDSNEDSSHAETPRASESGISELPTIDSSANEPTTVSDEAKTEAPAEVKEEVSEIPAMQDEPAAPATVEEAQKEEKGVRPSPEATEDK